MSVNMNQFTQDVVAGQLDLQSGGLGPAFTFRIDPDSSSEDIVAGTAVALKDGGANDPGGVPLVDVVAADTTISFGTIIFDPKEGKKQAGDIVQVSSDGNVQWMSAAAALARGVAVSLDVSAPGVVQAHGSTLPQFGILLDKASGADVLVRVLVRPLAILVVDTT